MQPGMRVATSGSSIADASTSTVGLAVGKGDVPAGQKGPDAVLAFLTVDVGQVVVIGVERHEWLVESLRPLSQVVIEHRLPGPSVHAGGVGEHTVEIEKAGAHLLR